MVSNITSNGDDTYTGTVTYTVTAADIAANVLKARVEATFNYKYAYGVRGDDTVRHDLNTTATIDSKSETIEINGIAATHTINYEYSFEGAGYQGSTAPTGVTFPSLPSSVTTTKSNTVEVSQTPKVGDTVKDDARGGNWKFLGWTLYDNAVTNVTMGDDDLTLEGRWEFVADTVNLTYDANAPEGSYSGSTATTSGYVGNVVHVAQNGFTREGYRFLNWNTSKDGTGAWFQPTSDYLLPVGGGTLYAQWAEGHRVSYQYNYVGANGIDSSAYPEGITLVPATSGYLWPGEKVAVSTAPANGEVVDDPANHGYWTFGGWQLAGQAAGPTVTMGASDVELLGTWDFAKYATLAYDGNGAGSGSVDGTEGAPGSAVGVAENGFSREGWRFAGWNTEPDGSGTAYDPADPLTLPQGATTLYAQWEEAKHVTYQYQYSGADGINSSSYPKAITGAPTDDAAYYQGDSVAVSAAPATRVVDDPANHGYWTFGGWQLAGQAAGPTVTMGASDVELLGTWDFAKYATLAYDGNGAGSGSVDGTEGAPGSAVGVAENGFSREGWRFAGWNTEPDGSGTAYDPADPLTLPQGATTLYAQWEKAEIPAAAAPTTTSEPAAETSVAAPTKAPLPQTSDATTQWPLVAGIASIGAALAAAAVLVRRRMNSLNE